MSTDASQPEPGADGPSGAAGWPGRFFRLCRKELREVLRDRRTIITLIGMPLLVYPLLSLTFQKFLLTSAPPQGTTDSILGFENESQMRLVRRYLDLGDAIWQRRAATRADDSPDAAGTQADDGDQAGRDAGPDASPAGPNASPTGANPASALLPTAPLRLLVRDTIVLDLEQSLAQGEIDVGVRVLPADGTRELPGFGAPLVCELWFRDESALSRATFEHVTERLELINSSYVRRQLAASGFSPELPAEIRARPLATGGSPLSLTTVVPLILILMTITGAVYPAIDVTAGERERGTMEALMAAPVPRLALLGAKYVAVLTVAVLTAVANLLAMTVTVTVTPWGRLLFDSAGISPLVIGQVFGLLILFAAFFSALLLAITSFARSFKEAQAYLIPLMLLSLAPGIISLMPGLEFRGALAVTPLVNMVLLARALLEGDVPAAPAVVAVLSTALYTIASIGLAARIFGTDALLSGSRFGWQDLFLRPAHARPAASPSGALACLALLFPAYFVLSNLLALLPLAPFEQLGLAALVTALLFGGLPLLLAIVQRLQLPAAFRLGWPPLLALPAALLLGLTLWPLIEELFLLTRWLGLGTIDETKLEGVELLLAQWRRLPPWWILVCLAATPAVFEELFFRGYLFTALGTRFKPRDTILLSALLFGLFHVVTTSTLALERLLPSMTLGLILGWICWRTRSVWPGVVLHACHNGLLLMVAYYRNELEAWGLGDAGDHLPWHWLALSGLGLLIGAALIQLAPSRELAPSRVSRASRQ